jgi:ATP-binding cassette subfamily B protein
MTRRGGSGGGGWGRAFGGSEPDLTRRPGSEGRTLRRIAGFFRPYRWRLGFIAVLILVTVSIGVVNPILLKLIIDNLTGPQDLGLLWLQAGLMIVLPIITSALGVWQAYLSNVVGQRVMDDLRLALYRHLQWMPLRFFTETRTGEIQSRISNDVGGVQSVVTDTAASLLSNFATVATTVVAMWILDWRLTVLSLGLLPVFAYITYRVGKVRREVSTLTQRSLAEVSAITEESLSVSGILLSKTFGQQEASIERFAAESRRLGDLQIRQQMIGRWFFALIGTFFSIMPAFVYLLAGTFIIGGETDITIGTIVAFTTLQSRLFFPLGQLLNVQVEIQGALALFDRIFEYLEMPHEITDAPDAVTLDHDTMRGDVRFENVTFRYPVAVAQVEAAEETAEAEAEGRALPTTVRPFALEGISYEARPGELVALVGPSGSGKTTSTYLIPRLYDVDGGSVSIDGVDVRHISLESLGRVIGFVTQETYLFHDTVLANLRYAKPDATMEEIEEAASAATSCQAGRSSASRSRASSSRTRASSSSTRRRRRSTPCRSGSSRRHSRGSWKGGRRSPSPIGSRPSCVPTRSSSCIADGSSSAARTPSSPVRRGSTRSSRPSSSAWNRHRRPAPAEPNAAMVTGRCITSTVPILIG